MRNLLRLSRFLRNTSEVKPAMEEILSRGPAKKVTWSEYFEYDYFWKKANLAPWFIGIVSFGTVYWSVKEAYYSFVFRSRNNRALMSDRFEWLHEMMIKDEVETSLLKKVPQQGFDKSKPGIDIDSLMLV
eukprot:Platyproteum_vivax@DN6064_c0_g1_i1.p1